MNKLTMMGAKSQGLSRYFTGKECPRGHIAERFVSTRACCECARERKHAWNSDNPDKVNAQKRAYSRANIEKVKARKSAEQKRNRAAANARNRRYAAAHREQIRKKNAAWEAANPSKVLAKAAKRRAAKARQMPIWADVGEIQKVYDRASYLREKGLDVHVDHIVPLQGKTVCGLHVHNNLRIIEAQQNRSKSNNF